MEIITIKDKAIIAFYKENVHLDIVSINHVFIDILKKLSTNLTSTLDNSLMKQILTIVSEMNGELGKINSEIMLKLHENKKEYLEDIKILLSNRDMSSQEKMTTLLDKSNDTLLTKTTLLLSDVNDKTCGQIENHMKVWFAAISDDTKKLLQRNPSENATDILDNIEKNFNKMVANIQQPIFNFIQASETRTQTNIRQVSENVSLQKQNQESLSSELNVFLNKYKSNSSVKGAISESELYSVLQSIAPSDEIIRCSGEAATCDIRLNRKDRKLPTILFENKDYASSVDKSEIEKFERDLQKQKCHGVFLSQNSPISYKENFQIDIINHIIHMYIPNCKYDSEKIKLAINIIDSLSEKITTISNNTEQGSIKFTNEEFEEMKEEYRLYAVRKNEMMDMIKTMAKQLIDKLDEIQMPLIRKNTVGNVDSKQICVYCNKFYGKSKASLSAHMKTCALKTPQPIATPSTA